jgi:hypothetical protein
MNYAARRPIFVIPFNQYGPAEIIANRFDGLTANGPKTAQLVLDTIPIFQRALWIGHFDSYVPEVPRRPIRLLAAHINEISRGNCEDRESDSKDRLS